MSQEREFDVICIGAGPAGEALASTLKGGDLSLAVVESNLVGGECPYWGCIPSKTLLRSAEVLAEADRAMTLAASRVEYTVDYPRIYRRTFEMAREEDDSKSAEQLEGTGATLVRGAGRLVDRTHVDVDGARLRARQAVVIATGTAPLVPPIEGLASVEFWTNREAVLAADQPERLIVLGAGAVGVELTQAFTRFGTMVHLIETTEFPLPLEEPEVGRFIQEKVLVPAGVQVHCGSRAVRASQSGAEISVTLDSGDVVTGDRLLVATGRRPNLDGLNLDAAGAGKSARGFLQVDAGTLLAAEGVYGIGDINGIGGFTHLSDYHGRIVGRGLRGDKVRANHVAVPRVTFTDPEVGSVGISEAEARRQGIRVRVAGIEDVYNGTARGYIHGEPGGLIKVIADADRQVVVGATLVGPRSGEILHELVLAIRAEVALTTLADVIHAFPTFSRALQGLAAELAG
jgi:pyruvate/2-oxoglutarate dehydrogenase complex dihydrolipoamide dehydrogenase (E3) component